MSCGRVTEKGSINIAGFGTFERRLYKPFDYKLEVKIGVLKEGDRLVLHVQGTPESVDKLSNEGITKLFDKIDLIKNNTSNNTYYRRIIAHASKTINEKELNYLIKINI